MDPKKLTDRLEWIQHFDLRTFLSSGGIPHPWFPVYRHLEQSEQSTTWFSALVPPPLIPQIITRDGWDVHVDSGHPSIWTHYGQGNVIRRVYCQFGNEEGIEPLVIYRNFHGLRSSFFEISQEFRLYHNLFHDVSHNRYLHFDDDGDDSEAVRYGDHFVEARTDLLLRFCAVKQMALAIFIDSFRYSQSTLEQLGLKEMHVPESGSSFGYSASVIPNTNPFKEGFRTFSRLLGKRYVLPDPMPDEDGRSRRNQPYQEFIIGTDVKGNPIKSTCDPEELDNYFGKNPGAPHYLTPVFFRAEVLSKYYADPQKYSVEDGNLGCGGLWSIRMDNDHADYVVVYLGDLGRDLSEKERNYWLSFNIPPEGRRISETNFRRSFMAEFADPKRQDLAFKHEYRRFRKDFHEAHGWNFFSPLHADDEHFFTGLRLPSKDNQAEFDSQLLALTKILVDSLNEQEIVKGLATIEKNDKGITKLEKLFTARALPDYGPRIKFLRVLQNLRSESAVHRKGGNYEKLITELQLADEGQQKVFGALLNAGLDLLIYLRANLLPVQQGAGHG